MVIEELSDGPLKKSLVGLLAVLGICVGAFVFTPAPPDYVVTLDDTSDTIALIAAVACGVLCCPGFLCIFIEKLRFPMLIIVAFVLLLFLAAVCLDHAYMNLNYALSKSREPEPRPVVIRQCNDEHFAFRYLDSGKDVWLDRSDPLPYPVVLAEGDTCVAYMLSGALGTDCMVDLRMKRRVRK